MYCLRGTIVLTVAVLFFIETAFSQCTCGYQSAGSTCSGGPTTGARNLANYLKNTYGGRTEIYNCRNIRGRNTKSLHAEGRAVDIYPGSQTMFNALIQLPCSKGIQEVIYNRKIWTAANGVRNYNGVNPHTDHLHVGLNRCGATNFSA